MVLRRDCRVLLALQLRRSSARTQRRILERLPARSLPPAIPVIIDSLLPAQFDSVLAIVSFNTLLSGNARMTSQFDPPRKEVGIGKKSFQQSLSIAVQRDVQIGRSTSDRIPTRTDVRHSQKAIQTSSDNCLHTFLSFWQHHLLHLTSTPKPDRTPLHT
jgi:hypothetical protein